MPPQLQAGDPGAGQWLPEVEAHGKLPAYEYKLQSNLHNKTNINLTSYWEIKQSHMESQVIMIILEFNTQNTWYNLPTKLAIKS